MLPEKARMARRLQRDDDESVELRSSGSIVFRGAVAAAYGEDLMLALLVTILFPPSLAFVATRQGAREGQIDAREGLLVREGEIHARESDPSDTDARKVRRAGKDFLTP